MRPRILKGFQQFLLRGNVVDLAVGVVIGLAFGAVVAAFVPDLLTPIVAAIFGSHDFSGLTFTIHHSQFFYGDFINKVIGFVTVAAAVFFFVVRPVNALMARRRAEPSYRRDQKHYTRARIAAGAHAYDLNPITD
jgi:large conductance mechanosensitive channel